MTDHSEPNKFARIAADLAGHGLSIFDDFIPPLLAASLATEARGLYQDGAFRHARVGSGASLQLRPEIRNDRILWIDSEKPSAVQLPYLLDLETLRKAINRTLYLGLFEFEAHFALYPPGASYDIHYDRFIGTRERLVTAILYLNDSWQPEDGGSLRIHAGETPSHLPLPIDIEPRAGRLVTFISEIFPHEVLPASRERLSLTGWFRTRS